MAKSQPRPPRLGRGLSSLMNQPVPVPPVPPASPAPAQPVQPAPAARTTSRKPAKTPPPTRPKPVGLAESDPRQHDHDTPAIRFIPLEAIVPNPHQPRRRFDDQTLQALAQSIRQDGVMQPVIVRPRPAPAGSPPSDAQDFRGYELVAGERRWRAAQLAKLPAIPAIIRQLNDAQLAEWSLIENLQREDLNPIERAQAFQRLIDQFRLTQDQIAQRVGIDRSSVANALRLLQLDADVQNLVIQNLLSAGHAKALAAVADPAQQRHLASRAVRQGLNVRQLEQLVRRLATAGSGDLPPTPSPRSSHLQDLERQITQQLGRRVKLRAGRKKGAGAITIPFASLDEFDQLMAQLGVRVEG